MITTSEQLDQAAPASPASELGEAFWKLKRSRIRISNALTTRASSIGDPCERRLFYGRTASELAVPHKPELQAIFDLGKELETFVIRELEAMGAEVAQRERDYLDRDLELSAHSDAKIQMRGWPRALTAEIKGLNPYTADHIESIGDVRDSSQHWVRKYYDQLQIYLYFDGQGLGVFVLMNKVSGQITFIDCPRDEQRIAALLAKAARVRDAVRSNEPPPRVESEDCGRCPFQHVCLPDRSFGPGAQILDDEEVGELIARKLELAEFATEIASIDKQLKRLLPEAPEVVVGDFLVSAKEVSRKGYVVEASTYWTRKFTRIHPDGGTR